MCKRLYRTALLSLLGLLVAAPAMAQDDIYATPKERKEKTERARERDRRRAQRNADRYADRYASRNTSQYYGSGSLDATEYESLKNVKRGATEYYADDDFYYSNRVRRFSDPWAFNSFYAAPFYANPWYGPGMAVGWGSGFGWNTGFSLTIGTGWGWGNYRPWGAFNPWYNPFWDPFWCPSPYAFGYVYSPWNYWGFGGVGFYNRGYVYGEAPNFTATRRGGYYTYPSNPGRRYFGWQVRGGTRSSGIGSGRSGSVRTPQLGGQAPGRVGTTPVPRSRGGSARPAQPYRSPSSTRPAPSQPSRGGGYSPRPSPSRGGSRGGSSGGSRGGGSSRGGRGG